VKGHVRVVTKWYSGVEEIRHGGFNLILVDGPNGDENYSRVGIAHYLPEILASSYVIIFDDAERRGEIMTIELVKSVLMAAGYAFCCFDVNGVKRQVVLCSSDLHFLQFS
jgi:hypothetical protein